jgi:hypothetical protein
MAVKTVRGNDVRAIIAAFNQLQAEVAEIKSDYNALLTKLDADAGVTDTNYASLRSISAADADTLKRGT